MELAADTQFNTTDGTGYRVESVVAMGADTDWRMDDMPAHTFGLVLNNQYDAAYRAEGSLHRDPDSVPGNWQEVTFDGGRTGAGHATSIYADWLKEHPNALPAGLDRITAGTGTQFTVHDIYR